MVSSLGNSSDHAKVHSTYLVLHPPQPAEQIATGGLELTSSRWSKRVWKHLGDGLPLEVHIGPRVAHRRVQAGVTQPLTDGRKSTPDFRSAIAVLCLSECGWMLLSRIEGTRCAAQATYRRSR